MSKFFLFLLFSSASLVWAQEKNNLKIEKKSKENDSIAKANTRTFNKIIGNTYESEISKNLNQLRHNDLKFAPVLFDPLINTPNNIYNRNTPNGIHNLNNLNSIYNSNSIYNPNNPNSIYNPNNKQK